MFSLQVLHVFLLEFEFCCCFDQFDFESGSEKLFWYFKSEIIKFTHDFMVAARSGRQQQMGPCRWSLNMVPRVLRVPKVPMISKQSRVCLVKKYFLQNINRKECQKCLFHLHLHLAFLKTIFQFAFLTMLVQVYQSMANHPTVIAPAVPKFLQLQTPSTS